MTHNFEAWRLEEIADSSPAFASQMPPPLKGRQGRGLEMTRLEETADTSPAGLRPAT